MTYFYARVSSSEQNLDRQLEVARNFRDVDEVFADKQTGKNFDRAEYQRLKSVVVAGDEVIVKELDRLGRNKQLIKDEIKWFRDAGVVLRILDVPTTLIDFQGQEWLQDMVNNILIEVMGAVAEQEIEKNRRRQKEGLDAMLVVDGKRVSRKTGRAVGRPKQDVDYKLLDGETVADACRRLGISRTQWYRLAREIA
jgi:DNA invertase Pin-like site-specific DNA recombinase